MKDKKLILGALVNALGVLVYIFLIALMFKNGEQWFGRMSNVLGVIAFLMLFTLSASVVAGLVFGRAIYLFFGDQRKESVKMALYTVGWLFILTILIFITIAIIK